MSRTILSAALFLTTTPLLAAAGSAAPARPGAAEWVQTPSSEGGRGFLGVSVQDSEDGVQVTEVQPGGGAAAAGIRSGDLLTAIGERSVESFSDLRRALDERETGDSVPVTVRRGDEELHLDVVLGSRASSAGRLVERPRSAGLEDLLRRREEFERSWRADLEQELEHMRGRFEDGWGHFAEELHQYQDEDDDGPRAHERERVKKDFERWHSDRLQALERMRSALRGLHDGHEHAEGDDHEGDGPNVWFYSPDGDELRFGQGWPQGWSGGWPLLRRGQPAPLAEERQRGPDLDGLRESVDDLREQVHKLRAEIDELRGQRSRSR